jgi:hypothetical protein
MNRATSSDEKVERASECKSLSIIQPEPAESCSVELFTRRRNHLREALQARMSPITAFTQLRIAHFRRLQSQQRLRTRKASAGRVESPHEGALRSEQNATSDYGDSRPLAGRCRDLKPGEAEKLVQLHVECAQIQLTQKTAFAPRAGLAG